MTRGVAAVTGALLLGSGLVLAASGGEVEVHRDHAGTRTTFSLHGSLVDLTIARGEAGRPVVVALVGAPVVKPAAGSDHGAAALARLASLAPCDDAAAAATPATDSSRVRRLLRIDYGEGAAITVLREGLSDDTYALDAFDRDGDGLDEILLYRRQGLATIPLEAAAPSASAPEPLPLLPEGTPPLAAGTRGFAGSEGTVGWFVLPELGGARIFGAPAGGRAGSAWELLLESPLPISVRPTQDEVKMRGVPLRTVTAQSASDSTRDGTAGSASTHSGLLAAGPMAASGDRLRSILINPAGFDRGDSAAGGVVREVWSALPSAEKIIESHYMLISGRPALVVFTRAAAKLSFFEEKLLRLFWLDGSDRSHAGAPPALAVESGMNLWQRAAPMALDVDRDGHEDLVAAYWKGLKDARVVLEVYPGRADGGFEPSAEMTEFDVPDAVRSFLGYGRDVTGDGIADLLLSAGGELRIHPGVIPRRGCKGLVESKARWAFPVTNAEAKSFDVDFDFGGDELDFSTPSFSWDPLSGVRFVDLPESAHPAILVRSVNADSRDLLHLILTSAK